MINALTVNALLTLCGLNAAELYNICERTISSTSQTIKPTIQVYETCSSSVYSVNSELNLKSWSKHGRKHQEYSLTKENSTNDDLCWVSTCSHLRLNETAECVEVEKLEKSASDIWGNNLHVVNSRLNVTVSPFEPVSYLKIY